MLCLCRLEDELVPEGGSSSVYPSPDSLQLSAQLRCVPAERRAHAVMRGISAPLRLISSLSCTAHLGCRSCIYPPTLEASSFDMSNRLYVGNLSYDTTEASLRTFFEAVGEVTSAEVILDRETQRSKGFGFVEMATAEQAQTALETLNGKLLDSRPVRIDLARPKETRPRAGWRASPPPVTSSSARLAAPPSPQRAKEDRSFKERKQERKKRAREQGQRHKPARARRGERFDYARYIDEEDEF